MGGWYNPHVPETVARRPFQPARVDEPLSGGPEDDGLLTAPVVRVAVGEGLCVQGVRAQLGEHCRRGEEGGY